MKELRAKARKDWYPTLLGGARPPGRESFIHTGEEAFKCSRDKEILMNMIKVKRGDN